MILSTSRSVELINRNRRSLERSLGGRFIREAKAASLTTEHFARYLAIEEEFVKTAVRVCAFTLFAEPEWASVLHHAATVESLLGEQLDYFRKVRLVHTDTPENLAQSLSLSAVLSDYVLGTLPASGYAGAIVNMFAAETLYLEWCSRVASARPLNPDSDSDAWIALHVSPEFKHQVRALGAFVDLLPMPSIPGGCSDDQLDGWFDAMLQAENAFHDSIYFAGE